MIEDQIKSVIKDIPDFPKPGVVFKDITPILLQPELCNDIVDEFLARFDFDIDVICGIESRGFFFGMPLAQKLQVPFVPIRKEGKLPGDVISYSYDLEYGSSTIEIHDNVLTPGQKVLLHDDLLATGGTAAAAASLIKQQGAEVAGISFLVNLKFLEGERKINNYTDNIIALAEYA